jgi:signal transduction histidine kinase
MSHDVRTPLTVLLGYLDLIEMQNEGQISDEYIASCRENAMRLKNLSDDMFSYFLVFGKSESDVNLSRVGARVLVEHIISEYTLLLSENGYTIVTSGDVPDVSIDIEERYFRRVIDNIFSNIMKYADIGSPVVLGAKCEDGRLTFYCENKRRTDKDIPESNGIGLRTCAKMMEEMGGGLSYDEVDGRFTVSITFTMRKNHDKSGS